MKEYLKLKRQDFNTYSEAQSAFLAFSTVQVLILIFNIFLLKDLFINGFKEIYNPLTNHGELLFTCIVFHCMFGVFQKFVWDHNFKGPEHYGYK